MNKTTETRRDCISRRIELQMAARALTYFKGGCVSKVRERLDSLPRVFSIPVCDLQRKILVRKIATGFSLNRTNNYDSASEIV